jgi:hypothetical protein
MSLPVRQHSDGSGRTVLQEDLLAAMPEYGQVVHGADGDVLAVDTTRLQTDLLVAAQARHARFTLHQGSGNATGGVTVSTARRLEACALLRVMP